MLNARLNLSFGPLNDENRSNGLAEFEVSALAQRGVQVNKHEVQSNNKEAPQ